MWQMNFYAVPLVIAAFPIVWLLALVWPYRHNQTVKYFMAFMGLALIMVLGYALELSSTTLERMRLWVALQYIGDSLAVVFLLFAISYAGFDHVLTRPRIISLFVFPLSILSLVITNDTHGLVWSYAGIKEIGGLVFFDRTYGVALWSWFIYMNLAMVIGAVLLVYRALNSNHVYRGQIVLLFLTLFFPWTGALLTVFDKTPHNLDLIPFGIALSVLPMAINLLYYDFSRLIPVSNSKILDSIEDAVIVCNPDRRIIQCNRSAFQLIHNMHKKKSSKEIVGELIEDIIPQMDADLFTTAIDNHTSNLICYGTRPYERCYNMRVSPLSDTQQGWIVILRDVTAERTAQAQSVELLLERERLHLLEAFIRDMSHDFRTPLTMIMSSAQLIDMQLERAEAANDWQLAKENIGKKTVQVESNSQRILNILQDMIEVTRLESTHPTQHANASINVVITEQVSLLASVAQEKHIHVTHDLSPDLPLLPIDVQTFGVAIHKLLDNALRYTPENGTVTVSTRIHEGNVLVDIADTGIGIDPTQISKIFHRFYRGDPTRPTTQGGAGLGLAIVKRVVDAHGGKISVRSKPNEGSTFRISLPFQQDPKTQSSAQDMLA